MIRRYYILPLRHGVTEARVDEFVDVLRAADRFIPGLRDSSAGVDLDSRTVLWENTFVDEESYSGPYMVHPYHIGAIDDFVMADSPQCLTDDIYVSRYQTPDAGRSLRRGLRRVLLLDVGSDADARALSSLAANADGMAESAFGADDVGWVSAKGRAWSHVWEQGFVDDEQLARYLRTRDGIACSSREGFTRLGIDVRRLQVFTCPFELTPEDEQDPAPEPLDERPVIYTLAGRVAPADVDAHVALLERHYDPFMAACGSALVTRTRTIERGYPLAEVQSGWRLDSLAAYREIRAATYADPDWNAFVRDAMPMVVDGTRRFLRAV